MALINCPECGKKISDKASVCPNCGCPVEKPTPQKIISPTTMPQRKNNHGCSVIIILFLMFCVAFGVFVTQGGKNISSIAGKYLDVTDEQGKVIDSVLKDCGITKVATFEYDPLLDNVHSEGETGYRLSINDSVYNIILYLNADKTVYSLSYNTYPLYSENTVVATLQDYTFTTDETSDLMIMCEDKVKEILASPSTANFPNILEWGFAKEKNIVTVQGYVDAQNAFGAEVRSNFQFIIDTDSQTIQSLVFDGEELIKQ